MGLIYHAFDVTNGKSYVGQTWGSFRRRYLGHLRDKRNHIFANVIRSRAGSLIWTVLTDNLQTQHDLDEAEIYWGEYFDCLKPNGYNLKLGQAKGKFSQSSKDKMSALKMGKKFSNEHKRNLAAAIKRHHSSPEGKAQLKAAAALRWSRVKK